MLLLFLNVLKVNDRFTWILYAICSLIFLSLLILLVVKRLIPSLKGAIALELNEEGIVDYIRNITINWHDIKEISILPGRSSSSIIIEMKWESDHGRTISISLRWVKGRDAEIFNTAQRYFLAAANL